MLIAARRNGSHVAFIKIKDEDQLGKKRYTIVHARGLF